jgi:hypothetical protein
MRTIATILLLTACGSAPPIEPIDPDMTRDATPTGQIDSSSAVDARADAPVHDASVVDVAPPPPPPVDAGTPWVDTIPQQTNGYERFDAGCWVLFYQLCPVSDNVEVDCYGAEYPPVSCPCADIAQTYPDCTNFCCGSM